MFYSYYKKFLTWFGDIMLATEPPKTKSTQILDLMNIIQEGDIICRKYTYYLDSYFIPGKYTHSGIIESKSIMYHSIAEGINQIHPIDFIKDTDGFIVLRPSYKSDGEIYRALRRATKLYNDRAQYDFTFNDPDKFYCHEFVCNCLLSAEIIIPRSIIKFGIFPFSYKKELYLADNIIKSCKIIYEF